MIKHKVISLTILFVLLLGIVQVTSADLDTNQDNTGIDGMNNQNYQPPDLGPEFQAIENSDPSTLPTFSPSPLNFNNMTPEVTSKVVQDNNERLIIQIDLEKEITQPGQPLRYVIQASRGFNPAPGESITIEIIKGEYWGWYHYYYYEISNYEDRVVERKVVTTDADGQYEGVFQSSVRGRYSIMIRDSNDNYYYKSRSFNIANLGIFWRVSREFVKGQPHYSVAYVLNTTDFSPITGAAVTLTGELYTYDYQSDSYSLYSEELFGGISDVQGVTEIVFTPPSNFSANNHFMANLSVTYGGETTFVLRDIYQGGYYWTSDGYQEFSPYEFIVTTDKPIYNPGETVQARVLLWHNDYLKATKEPVATSFTLKLQSPSQHILFQKTLKSNSYGVATYSFTLDSDSELGAYSIVTQKDEVISTTDIRVDKYEKPAYRVEIELDKEYVAPGQKISGTLTATYYFGKPVIQGQVELLVGDIKTLTGLTDEDGQWKFTYTLPSFLKDSGLYALSLNATVTDTVDREVSVSTSVQITENVYVWAWVNPWFPKADENVTLYFGAYQYSAGYYWWRSYQPMPEAEVTIKLYAMLSTSANIYVTSFQSKTDANGYGRYEFSIPQEILIFTTRFKGVVELNSGDGRNGMSTFYFSVDLSKVEASLESENNSLIPVNYSRGETVTLNVNLISILTFSQLSGSVRVRVFDTDYELIGETTSDVPTSGKAFQFQLSSYAPDGKYLVHIYVSKTFTYEWGSYNYYKYDTSVSFTVGTAQEFTMSLDKPSYTLSDSMTIMGQVEGVTNAPVMIQFVKKGILTTQYIPQSTAHSFSLTISDISTFAPKVWIYGFAILVTGQIQEVRLYVEIDSTLIVEIDSDKDVYTPGEEAKINIQVYDANRNPVSTVLAISFIDSSVFGVEPDPETELEHFKEQEFWPSVWTVSSWKSRQLQWWFWWYDDFYGLGYPSYWRGGVFEEDVVLLDFNAPAQGVKSGEEAPNDANVGQKIRDNLPENAYWTPFTVEEDGSLSITITLPDTIGEWTVRVVATSATSGLGVLEKYTFKTFIPFFVEIVKDPFVLQDDIFIIKGVVYNYLGELTDIDVSIEPSDGITILGDESQKIRLPSDFLGSISWACLAEDTNFVNVTIYATTELNNGSRYSDAIRKAIEIIPNGVETEFKASGFAYQEPQFEYLRFSEAVKQIEFLELSLGLGATAISSWERLVGYPYGCTEQTISRVVPDTLILDYLNETSQLTNETADLLTDMIVTGLSRLYSQQHPDGGWGWWSSDSSRVYMTALVLYGLSAVREVGIYVDPSVVKEALQSILEKQNYDGSWTTDSWRNIDGVSFTAFTLRSLVYWSSELASLDPINDAISYISNAWSDSNKQSSYLAALYLDAVMDSPFGSPTFETTLLSYLLSEVQLSGDGNYWKYTSSTGYYWRALGGQVEITGLAVKALVKTDPASHMPIIRGAIQWLLEKQSRYGWGNTADTSAAISSLVTISKEGFSSDEDANIKVYLNEEKIGDYDLSVNGQSVIYLNLKSHIQQGENNFSFSKSGAGNVSYYFFGLQTLRSLPGILLPSEVVSAPDQDVSVPIKLTPLSSEVFAANVTIKPIPGDMIPVINLPQTIQLLTQETTLNFKYETPSAPGVYTIPGFEIVYLLSNSEQSSFSPGIISRQYGPIDLVVLSTTEGMLPLSSVIPKQSPLPEVHMSLLTTSSVTGLTVDREFSKEKYIQPGDLIVVTLKVSNENESMNFLMLEESIPVGFSVDPSTVQHSQETYEVTSKGITFFFAQLPTGKTEVKYGLLASNIRQSLVVPAKLSSMYDDWIVKSTPAVLGEARVPIDPLTGEIIKDLSYPSLVKLELSEIRDSSSPYLNIEVMADDNWGIASVKVYIKQSIWYSFECFQEGDQWNARGRGLTTGNAQIYVEIMDYAGNVFVTGESAHMLDLGTIFIPLIPIISLIVFAFVTGAGISIYARKRGI
ncbi:MAG: MG2 domain-containing protein [Candidatus Hodarchaeales archaeon]